MVSILHWNSIGRAAIVAEFATVVCLIIVSSTELKAQHPPANVPSPAVASPSGIVHQGGVLQESYAYHRGEGQYNASTTITPPQGWYGYGFPVSSHRWGWFGAGRYYPTVIWHHGYMGNTTRWAYRQGY